jgi:hypothetical protein
MKPVDPKRLTTGWLIGVILEIEGERAPLRHYYAVGQPDRARAEWAAVDVALTEGRMVTSPVDGVEPVEAVNPLSAWRMKIVGLMPGEVRALGWKLPRRFLES